MEESYAPGILGRHGGQWHQTFLDDFSSDAAFEENWHHPRFKGWRDNPQNKWKWDAASAKEIWWDKACARVIRPPPSAEQPGQPSEAAATAAAHDNPFLRVGVFSDWMHRCDRVASKQSFGHGYFEARVRFRGAECMHSAFWLLGRLGPSKPTAPDPATGCIPAGIEVDVCEHRLLDKKGGRIDGRVNTAVHWGGYGKHHKSCGFKMVDLPRTCGEWTTFGLLHGPQYGGLRWYVDGREVQRAQVHSAEPLRIYLSTEVTPGPCWSGLAVPKTYGPRDEPAGWIDVDYVGHWSQDPPVASAEAAAAGRGSGSGQVINSSGQVSTSSGQVTRPAAAGTGTGGGGNNGCSASRGDNGGGGGPSTGAAEGGVLHGLKQAAGGLLQKLAKQ